MIQIQKFAECAKKITVGTVCAASLILNFSLILALLGCSNG